MRTDFVLALEGDYLTLRDRKDDDPAVIAALKSSHGRTVIRVLVDELPNEDEQRDTIETFEGEIAIKSGLLVATRYEEDEEEDDIESQEIDLPRGNYRWTLRTTLAGPCVPEKIDKETHTAYFKRTRPGETPPSWLKYDDESEEFWVGLILQLETLPAVKSKASRVKLRPGRNVTRPAVCPSGLASDRPVNWQQYVQTDLNYIHKIPKLVSKLEVEPISGGPVSVPISELVLPYWIAWICGETHPWIGIDCPADFTPEWPGFRKGVKETKVASGWRVDIEGMNARWTQFGHLRQVADILRDLPDGSSVELACASDDGEGKKGRHRYIGSISGGQWHIGLTHPPMQADTLRDMLDLARQGETGVTVRVRDEQEAERIARAILEKDFLLRETPPTRKGTLFQLSQKDKGLMPFLIARAFAARYPKTLPMIDRDDDLGDWDSLINEVAEAGAAFATGELVFDGDFAKFTRASLDDLPHANHDLIRSNDEWLQKSGFQLLGDLNSTQTFQAVFRGYGLPHAPIYAAVIANGFGSTGFDFYTRFADGHSLTTSRTSANKAKLSTDKKVRSYRNEVPGALPEMWTAHLAQMATLSEKHGTPAPSGGLPEFAGELDHFLCRQHGIAR